MRQEDLQLIQQRFERYQQGFVGPGGRLPPMLQLKLDHSRRVADDMRLLAGDSGWDAGGVALAAGLGLLHDIGRFEQYVRFGTFRDAQSVDHGACGARVAAAIGLLADLTLPDAAIILTAVRYHNVRVIPALPELAAPRALACLRLVRDADKLDIYRVLYEAWQSGAFREQPEILHDVDLDGPPHPAALADLQARRTVSFRNVHSLADFFLMQVSWAYDINYPAAARRLRERGCLERLAGVLPGTAPIRHCLATAGRHLAALAAG